MSANVLLLSEAAKSLHWYGVVTITAGCEAGRWWAAGEVDGVAYRAEGAPDLARAMSDLAWEVLEARRARRLVAS